MSTEDGRETGNNIFLGNWVVHYLMVATLFYKNNEKKQASVSAFFATPKKTKPVDYEKVTQAIVDMIASEYVPLSIIEGKGFKSLMNIVALDYTVPCRKTVQSRIERRYDVERQQLTSDLDSVSSAAITTDTWTSNSCESYITVTEHHVNDSWKLKSNVLMTRSIPERHTGENLANRIQDCVEEFNLDGKVESCVHDNARNMERCGDLCEGWKDVGCFAHTLQLCLKPAMEVPAVSKVVSRCRKLVGHFKHSTTLPAVIGERQSTMNIPKHSLIQDVVTRWNSTYEMLARLVEQRRVLTDILLDSTISKKSDSFLLLKESEWELISELCEVLRPFANTTEYLSTEKCVSLSEVYPIVCGLVNKSLVSVRTDSEATSRVKDCIRSELIRRYRPTSDDAASSQAALGALLDPRYKKLHFFTSHQRKLTFSALESRLDGLPLRLPTSSEEISDTPVKRRKLDFIDFGSPDRSTEDELQSYLSEKMVPEADP